MATGGRAAEESRAIKAPWQSPVTQVLAGDWAHPVQVHSVMNARDGMIWLAGSSGIHRYFGHSPASVNHPALREENGEASEILDLVQPDDDDRIWFLSVDGIGHTNTDGSEVTFTSFTFENSESRFRSFASGGKGLFWVVSDEGLHTYREREGFRNVTTETDELHSVIVDRSAPAILWGCDRSRGLVKFDSSTGQWDVIEPIGNLLSGEESRFKSICQTPDGRIWIGARNALHCYDPETRVVENHFVSSGDRTFWRTFTALHPGENGRTIWIGTSSGRGLMKFDTELNKFFSYDEEIRFQSTKMGINVADLTIDQSGVLWVATREDGLLRTPLDTVVTQIADNGLKRTQIFNSGIRCVVESGGYVYATSKNRITRIKFSDDRFWPDAMVREMGWKILDMVDTGRGSLLGLVPDGIVELDLATFTKPNWKRVATFPEKRTILAGEFSRNLDPSGRRWVVAEDTVLCYDSRNGELSKVRHLPLWGSAVEVCGDSVWVATKEHLISRKFDSSEETVQEFHEGAGINSFAWDGGSNLYASTNHGLIHVSVEDGSYRRLPGVIAPVSHLLMGAENDLWLVMSQHLRRYDLAAERIVSFPAQAHIDHRFGYKTALHRAGDSKILIKAWNSILSVEESELMKRPPDFSARLIVSAAGVAPGPRSGKGGLSGERLTLPPSSHGGWIQLGLLDFRSPENNRFEYRIDGRAWREAPNGRVEIGELENGSHLFEARATGSDGRPAANKVELEIRALPHFWETPWFYLLAGGAILGVGWMLHYYRARLILRAKQKLEFAHQALKESEGRFRQIFEESSDALVVADSELNILTANPSAMTLLKETAASLSQSPDLRRFDAGGIQLEKYVAEARSGEKVEDLPFKIVRENGTTAHTLLSISGADGEGGNLQFQLRDVTQQAELEVRLQQTQRMEAVGTLAGGIAHDFNNLLSPIVVHSQLAAEELRDLKGQEIPKVLESLQTCRSAAEQGADLVKKLLHFARKSDDGIETVDLVEMTRDATRFLRSSIPTHIDVSLRSPDCRAWVSCSPKRFEQVIMNMGVNAASAIGIGGGAIGLEIVAEENEGSEDGYQLRFSDDGCGMDEDTLRRVFEPFFTTREVGEGTGLGLSMVHSFAEEVGGTISVESQKGEGTTFTLRFPKCSAPVREEDARAKIERGRELVELGQRSDRVLVVDDDAMVLKATSMILQKHGYLVTSFNDPEQAIDHFSHHSDEFDAVVTDQMMPKITGLVLAERIREIQSGLPIVLLTGFAKILLEEGASVDSVNEVHMKPLDFEALDRSLQKLIRDSRAKEVELVS